MGWPWYNLRENGLTQTYFVNFTDKPAVMTHNMPYMERRLEEAVPKHAMSMKCFYLLTLAWFVSQSIEYRVLLYYIIGLRLVVYSFQDWKQGKKVLEDMVLVHISSLLCILRFLFSFFTWPELMSFFCCIEFIPPFIFHPPFVFLPFFHIPYYYY